MANVKIEMDRGMGWESRGEGPAEVTSDELVQHLFRYAIQYSHRGYLDGVLIATAERPFGARGKARIVRHDA